MINHLDPLKAVQIKEALSEESILDIKEKLEEKNEEMSKDFLNKKELLNERSNLVLQYHEENPLENVHILNTSSFSRSHKAINEIKEIAEKITLLM